MGTDNPRGGVQGMPGFDARPRLSGGEQSPLQNSTVVRQPEDLSGLASSLNQLSKKVMVNMQQQRKEQEEADRAVEYARLTAQTQVDTIQSFNQYQSSYAGNPDQFTEGYLQTFDQYANSVQAGITDQKLRNQFAVFSASQRAKVQLQALDGQNQLYVKDFQTKFTDTKAKLDDLIRVSPTADTLKSVVDSLDAAYQPVRDRLKAAGVDAAVEKDLIADKERFAKSMILRQATADPDQALRTLADPEVNKYIQDPGDQLEIENRIFTIRNTRNAPFEAEAKEVVKNFMSGVATGKDVSGLEKRLAELAQMGVVDESAWQKLTVAREMAGNFADLRNNMIALSQEQFEEQLAALDPANDGSPADTLSDDRQEFYNTAVNALRNQYKFHQDHPTAATAALTGASDPETAALQYIHARLKSGENINNINFLDKTTATQLQNQINNAITTGDVDGLTTLYNTIRENYGADAQHQYRQVAPGVDMADMVLTQISKGNNHPIGKKLIAAYHLMPKGEVIDSNNNLLIRAALMTTAQRDEFLTRAGMTDSSNNLNALDAKLMKDNKLWRMYFSPDRPTPAMQNLLTDQRALLKDTLLLSIATGGYKQSGGIKFLGGALEGVGLDLRLGATSAQDNAINAILENYLPYKAETVSGNPIYKKSAGESDPIPDGVGTIDPLGMLGDAAKAAGFNVVPTGGKSYGKLGLKLINPLDGKPVMVGRKDWRMNIKSSDILIPKEYEAVTNDLVLQYVSSRMLDDDFLFKNTRMPGINDNVTAPKASSNWGQPAEFVNKVSQIASQVLADPNDLMAVLKIESGFRPNAKNPNSTGTGLIQWMKPPGGLTRDQLANTPAMRQLDFVSQWFSSHKGNLNTPGKVYLAVAAPSVLRNLPKNAGPDYVVYKAGSDSARANPLWQDANGNVTLGKLDNLVRSAKKGKNISSGPQSHTQLDAGKRKVYDDALNLARQNIVLKNTEDLRGVRVYVGVGPANRPMPVTRQDGKRYLEFSFDEIQAYMAQLRRTRR